MSFLDLFESESLADKISADKLDAPKIVDALRDDAYRLRREPFQYWLSESEIPGALKTLATKPALAKQVTELLVSTNDRAETSKGVQVHLLRDDFGRLTGMTFLPDGLSTDSLVNVDMPIPALHAPRVSAEQRNAAHEIEEEAHAFLVDCRLQLDGSSLDDLKASVNKWLTDPSDRLAIASALATDDLSPMRNVEVHLRYGDLGDFRGVSAQMVTEAGPRMLNHQFSKMNGGFVTDPDANGAVLDLDLMDNTVK